MYYESQIIKISLKYKDNMYIYFTQISTGNIEQLHKENIKDFCK